MLIASGALLDKADGYGETPLLTASRGYLKIMKILITSGAILNEARKDGMTPLLCSIGALFYQFIIIKCSIFSL